MLLYQLRRNSKTIFLVVAIMVAITMLFYGPSAWEKSPGQRFKKGQGFKALGQSFSPGEVDEMREGFALAYSGGYSGPLFSHAMNMMGLSQDVQQDDGNELGMPKDFLINTCILRQQSKELGLSVSDEEAEKKIRSFPSFQTNGQFDGQKWKEFIDPAGGTAGPRGKAFYRMVKDSVLFDKLKDMIGADIPPTPGQVDAEYAKRNQKTTVSYVLFDKKKFEAQEVTEEEIKKDYDENKDAPELMTEEKRAIRYVLIAKPKPDELKDLDQAKKDEKERQYKLVAQQFSKALTSEDRNRQTETLEAIAKKLAEEHKFPLEVKTTEPFTMAALPTELISERMLTRELPSIAKEDPGKVINGTAGYYAVEVLEVQAAKGQELEAVKEKITKKLKEKKQTEALKKAVEEAETKLKEAIKGGKTWADAVKEAGLEAKELPAFSQKKPATDPIGTALTQTLDKVNIGGLSEAVSVADGTVLYSVVKRELPKDPAMEDQKKAVKSELASQDDYPSSNPAFISWFAGKKREVTNNLGKKG